MLNNTYKETKKLIKNKDKKEINDQIKIKKQKCNKKHQLTIHNFRILILFGVKKLYERLR